MTPIWPWSRSEQGDKPKASTVFDDLRAEIVTLPPIIQASGAFVIGCTFALGGRFVWSRFGRRVRDGHWVTPEIINRKKMLKGVVTSVGDGDNFRFFHTPVLSGYAWPFKLRAVPSANKELKDQTMHVRLAAVDAPELPHFGKEKQPFADEALAWLREKLHHRTVYILPVRKDQYSRVVAHVYLPRRVIPGFLSRGRNVSQWMLKDGWATVYEQAGAEYGSEGKELYERLQLQAQAAKRGMWVHGTHLETPAQYKKRHGAASVDGKAPLKPPSLLTRKETPSWWRWLFRGK